MQPGLFLFVEFASESSRYVIGAAPVADLAGIPPFAPLAGKLPCLEVRIAFWGVVGHSKWPLGPLLGTVTKNGGGLYLYSGAAPAAELAGNLTNPPPPLGCP